MISIRIPVAIALVATVALACYLGFSLIRLDHDKAVHFVTFFVITCEFYFVFDTHHKSLKMLRYVTLLTCTFGASVALEVVQHLVNPARVFDVYDIASNVGGSGAATAVCSWYSRWQARRLSAVRFQRLARAADDEAVVANPPTADSDELYVDIAMDLVPGATDERHH